MAIILVAESEPPNQDLYRFILETQGDHEVRVAPCLQSALTVLHSNEPDLVIADASLAGKTAAGAGLDLCRHVRRTSAIPIIVVSSLTEAGDRIAGLRAGADDYVTRPFDPWELLERVHALLRRARRYQTEPSGGILRAGRLRLRLLDHQVWVDNRGPIALTPTECRLLYLFLLKPYYTWPREELLARLWDLPAGEGPINNAGPRATIESYVARLRAKIERMPHRPVLLVTVRGSGYQMRPQG